MKRFAVHDVHVAFELFIESWPSDIVSVTRVCKLSRTASVSTELRSLRRLRSALCDSWLML